MSLAPLAQQPAPVPGTIQAEDFDEGGSGVAYQDTSVGNLGGQYRVTDVDIEPASDAGGGYNIAWAFAGEWLNYTATVGTTGAYDLEIRVASAGAGGTFHIEVNGVDKTGPLTVPNTGGWQNWTTVRRNGVDLSAGQQVWRLVMDSNGPTTAVGNFNYIRATTAPAAPSAGAPAALPGVIQAEDFDNDGPGVGFADNTAVNSGWQYRDTAVDIESTLDAGGGYDVGWAFAGEWLKYTVNVGAAATYDLEVRVASAGAGGTFHIEVNGIDVTGPLVVSNTGAWQAWTTLRKTGVALGAGQQVWRLVMDTNGATGAVGNFNYIRVTAATSGAPYGVAAASMPGSLEAENFDEGAAGVAYADTTPGNSGGQYRATDVDIERTSDAGGGNNVAWAFAGEWLNYAVTVTAAGTYDVDVRVASGGAGGRFHIEVNGVDKTGPLTIPNTGGWQIWTTIRKTGVSLSAGPQVWRLVMDANGATTAVGNFNWIRVSQPAGLSILRGPYLQQVTDVSAIVVWTTRDPGVAEVRYSSAGGPTFSTTAQARLFPVAETGLTTDFYQYEARLAGLAPASNYTYDVFMAGVDATPGQDAFNTAPRIGGGSVRFIAFGDSGVGVTAQRQLAARMAADAFDLALHTGNVAYGTFEGIGGPSYTQYDDWAFGVYSSWLRSRPFYPSIGNHDDEIGAARAYRDMFVLPDHGASASYPDHAERYYSFDYGPVHFVALDTELAFIDPARRQAQVAWLDADLAGTNQPWRVVYFHRPPYSAGTSQGSSLDVRQTFAPIFERHRVQLVVSGHDRDYERSTPWREYGPDGGAVTYIVTGGGGAPLYPVGTDRWTASSASVHHYVRVAADDCVMTLEGVGLDGVVFDRSSIDRCAAPNQPPQVSITGPADGTSFTLGSDVSISAAANDGDGTISRVDFFAGSTLIGSATADPPTVTWSPPAAGTYSLTAVAVDNDGATATSTAVSIMVDRALNQPPTVTLSAPANGATYTGPATVVLSATASDPENSLARVEFYSGTTLLGTATAAPYSFAWSSVAAGTYGLRAAAYDTAGASATSGTATITVTAANQAPTVTLTAPANGATYTAPATVSLTATATDADGTIARVEFYNGTTLLSTDTTAPYAFTWSSAVAGTYAIRAIAYDLSGASGTSATATITVAANQAPTVTLTAPANGATYTAPATVSLTASVTDADGTIARVEFYNGTTLLNTDTTAPYAFTWSSVAAGTYAVRAVAFDNGGASGTSATSTITVTAANQAPTATLTAPANGATYTAPATVSLSASATDTDGTIARVEFYNGTTLLNTDTTAPYTFTWSSVVAGAYAIRAIAYDNGGASGTSATATMTVAANQAPTVTLTAPANGSTYTAPATVSLTASATDADGTIARVEFYSGSTLLSTDTTAPYGFTWSSVPAGTYGIRAVAYDNSGASTTSATTTITVSTPTTAPPTGVVFQASADHASLVTSYELRIFASGADPATATPLAVSDLGKPTPDATNDITVDRAAFFSALAPGSYVAAVAAIGTGGTTTSTGVAFTR